MNESLICKAVVEPIIVVPFFYSGKSKVDYLLDALRLEDRQISTIAFSFMFLMGMVGLGVFALETTLAVLAIFAQHSL